MGTKKISSSDIRLSLAKLIASKDLSQKILREFLNSEKPDNNILVEIDKIIISYLNANSTPVYSKGARFFLPISKKFGELGIGEKLVYSEGERKGQSIGGGGIGIKFKNQTDSIEQGVVGNGTEVIIIGGAVTPERARLLQEKLSELTNGSSHPEDLSNSDIKSLIAYAENDLGLNDIWTGDISDVLKAKPVDNRLISPEGDLKQYTGHFVHVPVVGKGIAAIHIKGSAEFYGDVAGGFQDYSNSEDFFVTIGVRDGVSQYRGIEASAFCRDYVNESNENCTSGILFTINSDKLDISTPTTTQLGKKIATRAL